MRIIQPSYSPDQYVLRFYKEFGSQGGYDVRLEIHEKFYGRYPFPQDMATLCGVSLTLEGNGQIDDPVTKSTLQFSVVDDVFREDPLNTLKKYGNWEALYTPDATAYLVVLLTKEHEATDWSVRWRGYVTPDSWEEDLDSYGQIHITARDNIGHLADFEFDLETESGTISVEALLVEAMKKIALPMELRFNTSNEGDAMAVSGGDVDIIRAAVCVEAFKGKSWYEAIESVLSSLGMTLRYTDNASVTVMHLANLPLYGNVNKVDSLEPVFHGGTKLLDPAYKEIVSEIDFGAKEETELNIKAGVEFTGSESTYSFQYTSVVFPSGGTTTGSGYAPYHKISGSNRGWNSLSALFNPNLYELGYFLKKSEGESARDYVFLVANQTSAEQQLYTFDTNSLDIRFTAEFAPSPLCIRNNQLYDAQANLSQIDYVVMVEGSGVTKYWNGYDWQNAIEVLTVEYDAQNASETIFEVALRSCEDITTTAQVTIAFQRIAYKPLGTETRTGIYARVKAMTVAVTASMLESDKVRTINNESYNVKAERNLEVGALSKVVAFSTVQSYINALWDMTSQDEVYQFSYYVTIGPNHDEFPLPVIIHKQLLMFHHLAQPVLSGNCSVPGVGVRFDRLYKYKGVTHILQGGTFDLVSGMMEGITLRGFVSYQNMWLPHTDIDFAEVGYGGGNVVVKFIADDNVSWSVTAPEWITPSVDSGTGTADIVLYVQSSRTAREGVVRIGPSVVKIVQKAVGAFNTDYNDDFKVFRDFNEDYYIGDIN